MALLSQLFGFPSLTLASTAESLLAIKVFPNYYGSQNHLSLVALIFSINYLFGVMFWKLVYPNFISPLRGIPGPKSLFSASHRTLLVTDRPGGDIYLDIAAQYPGEDMLKLSAFGNQILITKPRLLADLLVHRAYDFSKPGKVSKFLRYILGDGLIIVEGDQHKFLRKNTMPAFSFRHIKNLYPMMWEKAIRLTSTLKKEGEISNDSESKGFIIELSAWASRVTLDIIGIAGFGRKFNMLDKAEDPILRIYEELLEPSTEKLVFAFTSFVFGLPFVRLLPWKMNDVFNNLSKSLNNLSMPMIQEKRDAITEKGDDHFDVLSLLIKSNNFSDSELKDQVLTFLAAGHETTASALTWSCYLLAKHPDFQQKLREEVREALPIDPSTEETVDLAGTLEQLPLLNGIINETLRLFPTVPATMREAVRDTHLGGQVIPKGTMIVLSMWLMNRSPEVWGKDAGEFRPGRWVTEDGKPNQNGGASSNYDFLTFLHGPRSCIGQGFAKAEMRCLLAAMVGSFSWDLAMDDAKILPRGVITIKPANGLRLRLRPLEQ